jgi:hypothetical protein
MNGADLRMKRGGKPSKCTIPQAKDCHAQNSRGYRQLAEIIEELSNGQLSVAFIDRVGGELRIGRNDENRGAVHGTFRQNVRYRT